MSPEVGDNREILAYFCFMLRALLLSACCASADLSSWCVGGALLCNYDAKSRYCQVNKFPRQHHLFTSDLRSCTTAPPLGLLSASAAVSSGVVEKVFRFPLSVFRLSCF